MSAASMSMVLHSRPIPMCDTTAPHTGVPTPLPTPVVLTIPFPYPPPHAPPLPPPSLVLDNTVLLIAVYPATPRVFPRALTTLATL